ncbi:hypothetical protein TNCV_2829041 [Trichonephila clavipes]|nr:hypothetical protein TNCV_2829041 [Trichonephila clavipes]
MTPIVRHNDESGRGVHIRNTGKEVCKKNSGGRSPLAEERDARLTAISVGQNQPTQFLGVENKMGRSEWSSGPSKRKILETYF